MRHRSIDDRDIEPAIVVGVQPRRAERGTARSQSKAGLRAFLDEHTRAVVDVQVRALPRQLADEDILVAVVVDVAASTPMLALSRPSALTAAPARSAVFLKVRLR